MKALDIPETPRVHKVRYLRFDTKTNYEINEYVIWKLKWKVCRHEES